MTYRSHASTAVADSQPPAPSAVIRQTIRETTSSTWPQPGDPPTGLIHIPHVIEQTIGRAAAALARWPLLQDTILGDYGTLAAARVALRHYAPDSPELITIGDIQADGRAGALTRDMCWAAATQIQRAGRVPDMAQQCLRLLRDSCTEAAWALEQAAANPMGLCAPGAGLGLHRTARDCDVASDYIEGIDPTWLPGRLAWLAARQNHYLGGRQPTTVHRDGGIR